MLDDELKAAREDIIRRHLAAETAHDVDGTLATMTDPPVYELVPSGEVLRGREQVGALLQKLFTLVGDIEHRALAFYHTDEWTFVEGVSSFPPESGGPPVPTLTMFHFDSDRCLGERIYADMSLFLHARDSVGDAS
jgi:hypothetical protein